MKALERQHPDGARKLVHEIREKANGVFLWVKLVVKLLIQGMQNGDQLSDLQRRLQSLPPDLKDLYERMFRKMDTLYQIQAAETFQIIRRWDSVRPTHKLTTLMLSYATSRPENWTTLQPKPLDPVEALYICKRTEAWVRSRCCGLVEVHEDDFRGNNFTSEIEGTKNGALDNKLLLSSKDMKLISSTISYLHKSVAEFLYSKDIWGDICKMTAQPAFDANASLALGALLFLRSRSLEDSLTIKEFIYSSPEHFTSFLTITETFSDQEYLGLIDVFDKTMAYLHKRPCSICSASNHWEHHLGDHSEGNNLFTFAIRTGLHRYVQLQRSRYPMRQMVSPDQPLIMVVLPSWTGWTSRHIPLSLRKRTLEALLQNYALNEPSPDRTYYWQYAINDICKAKSILPSARDRAEFLKALLSSNKLPDTFLRSVWRDVLLFSRRMQNQPQPRQSQRGSLRYDPTNEDWDAVIDEIRSLGRELEQLLFDLNPNQVLLAPSTLPPQY